MSRYLIYVPALHRCPPFKFYGKSGKAYVVRWSDAHKAMCVEGTDCSAADFDRIGADLGEATREQNDVQVFARRVPAPDETSAMPTLGGGAAPQELTRVCGMLGAAEEANGRLSRENRELRDENAALRAGKGLPERTNTPQTPPPPQPPANAAPQVPAGEVPKGHEGTYDPDDL